MSTHKNLRQLYLLLLLLSFSGNLFANNDVAIPEPLKPWKGWVLHDIKDNDCPFLFRNHGQRFCSWPGSLNLNFDKSGGTFEQRWQVYQKSWIRLPGNVRHWPQSVTVNNNKAIVTQRNGFPVVELKPGNAVIKGQFEWEEMPESFPVEPGTALIKLTVNGKRIPDPHLDTEGKLWLLDNSVKAAGSQQQDDVLDISVYRRLIDDVPFTIVTLLDINVSGDQREVLLENILIENTIPTDLNAQLPARLESKGNLRMQVRPGRWNIEITTRYVNAVTELRRPVSSAPWPAEEIWVFDARSYLRVVEVQGVTPIDPRQTNLPNEWKSLPSYRVNMENRFELVETRRGNLEPEPNQLTLKRQMWLDFSGDGYTVKDHISGSMRREWRLEASDELELGRVLVNNQPQLITSLEGSDAKGVEVRQGQLNLEAVSRYEGSKSSFPVGGWAQSFQQIETTLHLPPGWRLFSASGVDNTPNTWLQSWTLLDFFLVLILSMAVARLWNFYWGLIALVTFTLIWQEPLDAPRFVWINVLIAIALLRVVPKNNLRKIIMGYRNLSLLALVIISVPFMVQEVRTGIYPQLEKPWQNFKERAVTLSPQRAAEEDVAVSMESLALSATRLSRSKAPSTEAVSTVKQVDKLSMLVDPNATLQTGPGLPDWTWNKVRLSWNGPNELQQRADLVLLSPVVNMILNFMRVAFLLLLFVLMFDVKYKKIPIKKAAKAVVIITLLPATMIFSSQDASAELPDEALLKELKQRLTKAPDCLPGCAAVSTLRINISGKDMNLTSTLHVHELVAVPLPAKSDQWLPSSITTDGRSANALFRSSDGVIWIAMEPGIHTVKLSGSVPDRSYFQLPLLLRPHHVSVTSKGWTIDGVSVNGVPDSQIQFSRIQKQQQSKDFSQLQAGPLPPFVRVERTLNLGLDWQVVTRVRRVSTSNVPIVFELPLLAGEGVLDENINVKDGKVLVSLSTKQKQLTWASRLNITPEILLNAENTSDWIEVWRLDVSPIWHVTSEGIPVIHHQGENKNWLPEWHPYPGESIKVNISRPASVHGKSLTIERSNLVITPGSRMTESELRFSVRSSQGAQHTIMLPPDANLDSVHINNVIEPIRQEGRRVTLPVNPGEHEFKVLWRLPHGLRNYYISQEVDLGLDSVNHNIQLKLPSNQWVLLTAGPHLGPAVLYWGIVIIVLILSAILSFTKLTPLRFWHWALLGIGLSQVHITFALVVVGWLLLFGLRRYLPNQSSNTLFNLAQIGYAFLTIVALAVLFYAIQQGLLGKPDMQIAGNGSTAYNLNWYQDQVQETLPKIWVLSVPLTAYRVLMLLWALWLAYSVLNWLKWTWKQYAEGGYWRKSEKKTNTENEKLKHQSQDVNQQGTMKSEDKKPES
ncbi:hypothetical protein [Kaarinaea lacus]